MNARDKGINVMRNVIQGKIPPRDIPSITPASLQIHAAVAFILRNHERYLNPDFSVHCDYGELLYKITGGSKSADELVELSRQAKLHFTAATLHYDLLILTPPREVPIAPPQVIPAAAENRAEAILRILQGEGRLVMYAVYRMLERHFSQ